MPQKGRFVEEVATQSSNFTSASRGQISDKSLGSLFEGAGSAVSSAIKIADNQFQESIENKVDNFYADETKDQDPAIMDFSSEGVPSEITSGTDNIIKMSKAFGNGLISDSQFFMRASALSKRLKSQYPGHKDYVDAAINKARGTSANSARRSLLSELDKLQTASQKQAADSKKAVRKAIQGGYTTTERVNAVGADQALLEADEMQGRNAALTRDMENINLRLKTGASTREEAATQFIGKLPEIIGPSVNVGLARGMGYTGNLGNFQEFSAWMNSQDPSKMDADRLEQIYLGGNQLISQIRTSVLTNETYQNLGDEGQKQVLNALNRQLAPMEQFVKNKDFNGMTAAVEAANIGTQAHVQRIKENMNFQEFDVQRTIVNDMFPEGSEGRVVLTRLLNQKWEDPAMKVVTQGLVSEVLAGVGPDGNPTMEISDMMTKMRGLKDMKPEDKVRALHTVMEASKQVFRSRDPNDPRFKDTALALFKQRPDMLLRHWSSQEAKLQVFNSLIDPTLSTKLMQTDPEAAQAYKDFVIGSFSGITNSQVGDLNNQAARFLRIQDRQKSTSVPLNNMEIKLNPEKGLFEVGKMTGTIDTDQRLALESMQKINGLLAKVLPILTADGTSNPQAMSLLLSRSKQNFDQDPWANNISQVMADWWKSLPSEEDLIKGKSDKK